MFSIKKPILILSLILLIPFLVPVHGQQNSGSLLITVNQICSTDAGSAFVPLQGAKVTVIGPVVVVAYSGQGGYVNLQNLPVGSYVVVASRVGFMPDGNSQPLNVDVNANMTSTSILILDPYVQPTACVTTPINTPANYEVATKPNSGALLVTVTNYCTNAAGWIFMPLSGVQIQGSPAESAVTDDGGNALLINLTPNTYTIVASKQGFISNDNFQSYADVWANGTATVSLMLTPIGDQSCNTGDPPPTTTTTLTSSASSSTVTATATTTVTTVTVTMTSVPEFPTQLSIIVSALAFTLLLLRRRKRPVSS